MPAAVANLSADGVTQITQYDFGALIAGTNVTPRKFGVYNTGSRSLGSPNLLDRLKSVGANDGSTMVSMALDSAAATPTLSPPYGTAANGGVGLALGASGAGGVWAATGTYGYRITSTNATGESGPQVEATILVDDTTKKVTVTWTTIAGATGYKLYRASTPGTYPASSLRATLGAVTTFLDDGSAVSAGTLPTTNTSGGWALNGTLSAPAAGGVWAGTGVRFWKVVAYDSTGIEIANSLEFTVNVNDVTKTVALTWSSALAAGAGASSIKVYRSTVSGVYTTPALVTTLAGNATNYTDTGTAVTTGAWSGTLGYGLPPANASFSAVDVNFGAPEPVGLQDFFWVLLTISGATSETGNPRQATMLPVES